MGFGRVGGGAVWDRGAGRRDGVEKVHIQIHGRGFRQEFAERGVFYGYAIFMSINKQQD